VIYPLASGGPDGSGPAPFPQRAGQGAVPPEPEPMPAWRRRWSGVRLTAALLDGFLGVGRNRDDRPCSRPPVIPLRNAAVDATIRSRNQPGALSSWPPP